MKVQDQHSIECQLIDWILDLSGSSQSLTADVNFVSSGLLDSFAVLGLIMQIEKFYGFKFEISEISNPELQVISRLSCLIVEKLAG